MANRVKLVIGIHKETGNWYKFSLRCALEYSGPEVIKKKKKIMLNSTENKNLSCS